MVLCDLVGFIAALAACLTIIMRASGWLLTFLRPELSYSIKQQLSKIKGRRAMRRVKRLIERLYRVRRFQRDLRRYIAAWGLLSMLAFVSTACMVSIGIFATTATRAYILHDKPSLFFNLIAPGGSMFLCLLSLYVAVRIGGEAMDSNNLDGTTQKTMERIRNILSPHLTPSEVESIIKGLSEEESKVTIEWGRAPVERDRAALPPV